MVYYRFADTTPKLNERYGVDDEGFGMLIG